MMNYSRCSKKLRTENTILNALSSSALYGDSSKSTFQVSELSLKHFEEFNICALETLFRTVKQLDETLLSWHSTKADVLQLFWEFNFAIQELLTKESDDTDSIISKEDENTISKEDEIVFRDIIFEETAKILWRFVMSYSLFPLKEAVKIFSEKEESLQLKGVALELLHNIFAEHEGLAKQRADDQTCINCVFSYMQFRETCFPACKVLECLILVRKSALDLSSIVLFPDEKTTSLCSWDARNAGRQRLLSLGHNNTVRFIVHSPVSPSFVTCSDDFRARFWYRRTESGD